MFFLFIFYYYSCFVGIVCLSVFLLIDRGRIQRVERAREKEGGRESVVFFSFLSSCFCSYLHSMIPAVHISHIPTACISHDTRRFASESKK